MSKKTAEQKAISDPDDRYTYFGPTRMATCLSELGRQTAYIPPTPRYRPV